MGCFTQIQRTVTNCTWKPTNSLICFMWFNPKTFHTEHTFCQLNRRKALYYDNIPDTIKINTYLKFFFHLENCEGASLCRHYAKQAPAIFEQFIPVLQSAWAPALKYTSKLIQPVTSLEKGMWMCLISLELTWTVTFQPCTLIFESFYVNQHRLQWGVYIVSKWVVYLRI